MISMGRCSENADAPNVASKVPRPPKARQIAYAMPENAKAATKPTGMVMIDCTAYQSVALMSVIGVVGG